MYVWLCQSVWLVWLRQCLDCVVVGCEFNSNVFAVLLFDAVLCGKFLSTGLYALPT